MNIPKTVVSSTTPSTPIPTETDLSVSPNPSLDCYCPSVCAYAHPNTYLDRCLPDCRPLLMLFAFIQCELRNAQGNLTNYEMRKATSLKPHRSTERNELAVSKNQHTYSFGMGGEGAALTVPKTPCPITVCVAGKDTCFRIMHDSLIRTTQHYSRAVTQHNSCTYTIRLHIHYTQECVMLLLTFLMPPMSSYYMDTDCHPREQKLPNTRLRKRMLFSKYGVSSWFSQWTVNIRRDVKYFEND